MDSNSVDLVAAPELGPGSYGGLRSQPTNGPSFSAALGSLIDGTGDAVARADGLAGALAVGKASVADAAIARAKADTMLDVLAALASRVSNAVTTLTQTQV